MKPLLTPTPHLEGAQPIRRVSMLYYARKFGVLFVLTTILFGVASFLILLGLTPIEPSERVILTLVAINALFVSLLMFLVGRELWGLLQARKRGRAAARMHINIVGLFGVVAAFPAIVVAVVAGITLDLGLDRIFDIRTKSIVENSISVAKSYVQETGLTLNSSTADMAFLLVRNRSGYVLDRQSFEAFMTGQAKVRGFLKAAIVRLDGSTVVEANLPHGTLPPPPPKLLELANKEERACGGPRVRSLAGCIIKVKGLGHNLFLYTLRAVDAGVINSINLMEEITDEYRSLESGRLPLQIAFALLYGGICLTILLSAIWMGIAVADRLVEPIRRLINAADQVSLGNLDINVPATRAKGELRSLTNTFNEMIGELQSQRNEILKNQEQIDSRRRFTEAVLSGVTAGVIGIDNKGGLSIVNSSALDLLADDHLALVGMKLHDVSPELHQVFKNALAANKPVYREQITVHNKGRERTLNVQLTVDERAENMGSHVMTIDDITDLVTAQRSSAWADVARRIAHEIKNPLTPIQLSAERIRRRYGKVITQDREVFDQCTDTIVRQVADIGRMVDEFSSFARMPKPKITRADLRDTIREAVFLLKVSHPEIIFDVTIADEPILAQIDTRLLGQALGNLIKNATEAIEGVDYEADESPTIKVQTSIIDKMHCIEIIDNGKGLPTENRQRLLEPYMTTREKGTGLGLAIVGKILEEHGGHIELCDAPMVASGGRGAMIRVFVPQSVGSPSKDHALILNGEGKNEKNGAPLKGGKILDDKSEVGERVK